MRQDVFLSHASRDKRDYVNPLTAALKLRGVTFWLDSAEIAWGDNVTSKLNAGLRNSRYALVCLSAHFLERPWPEAELSAALSLQNTDGTKRVLPLILNARDRVLRHYPLIAGMAIREFSAGPKIIAEEIAAMVRRKEKPRGAMRVTVESVHTDVQSNLDVTAKNSVRQDKTYAIVVGRKGVNVCTDEDASLGSLGIMDGTVFHLYAIEEVIRRGGGAAKRGAKYR